jgi:DNA-binding transcriptional MerR regulator
MAGFTLSDIETLLSFRDGEAVPCGEVQSLIAARLAQVHHEREHLEEVERLLKRWLGVCRMTARTGRCGVLEALSAVRKKSCNKDGDCP